MSTARETETRVAEVKETVAECAASEALAVEKLPELTSARERLEAERDSSRVEIETAAQSLTAKMASIDGLQSKLLESENARRQLAQKLFEAKTIGQGLRQSLGVLLANLRE